MAALPHVLTQMMALKVPELQECCSGLGLSRTGTSTTLRWQFTERRLFWGGSRFTSGYVPAGRKAELQVRLVSYLGDRGYDPAQHSASEAWRYQQAKAVITSVYCKSRGVPWTPFAARADPGASSGGAGPSNAAAPAPSARDAAAPVRCICQSPAHRGRMVQCRSPDCRVWQHEDCMRVPPAGAAEYHCELCRARLADPFWEPVEAQLLPPTRVQPAPGRPPVQDVYGNVYLALAAERSLYLTDQHLAATRGDAPVEAIRVACLQLDDEVPLRYHWPRHAELRWNSLPYRRLHPRRPEASLGVNQRDEPASVAPLCVRGRNSVTLVAADAGAFVLLLQRCRRRSTAEVLRLMEPAEMLAEAAARVRRLVGGDGDGDGDGGVVVAGQVVSLKDPLSSQRMKVSFQGLGRWHSLDLASPNSISKQDGANPLTSLPAPPQPHLDPPCAGGGAVQRRLWAAGLRSGRFFVPGTAQPQVAGPHNLGQLQHRAPAARCLYAAGAGLPGADARGD